MLDDLKRNIPFGFKLAGKRVYMYWGKTESGQNKILSIAQDVLTDEEVRALGIEPPQESETTATDKYAMIYATARPDGNLSKMMEINPNELREIKMGAPAFKQWGVSIEDLVTNPEVWLTEEEVKAYLKKEGNKNEQK